MTHEPFFATAETILTWTIFAAAALVFVVVEGLLIVAAIRLRQPPDVDNAAKPQTRGQWLANIAWTVVPALATAAILVWTLQTVIVNQSH
jgi:heme/copper-type cytochrome/quinol oxidase subunit 2